MPVVSEDALSISVADQRFRSPLMGKIPIEAFAPTHLTLLIDVTEYYDGSSTLLNHLFDLISIGGSPNKELSRIVERRLSPPT